MGQDPYRDHPQMANHWWWRPGWGAETRFYTWHITLDGQDDLHELIDRCQAAVAPFPTLDPIPRQWRHITLQGLGHVSAVRDVDRNAAVEAVSAHLARLEPLSITFQRACIFREALALKPNNPAAFAQIRSEVRAGIAEAWGYDQVPEASEGFRAHVSLAYSNGDADSAAIRRALDDTATKEAHATFSTVSLIRMRRDQEMYQWATVTDVPLGPIRTH